MGCKGHLVPQSSTSLLFQGLHTSKFMTRPKVLIYSDNKARETNLPLGTLENNANFCRNL